MPLERPEQGDPTRLEFIDALLDELESISALAGGSAGGSSLIPNGSFETDTDENDVPDGWTWTAQTGGTKIIDTAESASGGQSFKVTSPGGSGNGGGELIMTEPAECSPQRPMRFAWQMKCSAADVRNVVEVRWYSTPDEADYISTTTIYDEDTNNPTVWQFINAFALPPATAKYFKLKFIACDSSDDTAGNVWLDDVSAENATFTRSVTFAKAGTFQWIVPANVFTLRVRCIGAGGNGGAGSAGSPGSGGGGGGYSEKIVSVTPGQVVTIVVGAPNGGGSGIGGPSSFETSVVIANGGGAGVTNDSTPPGGAGATIVGAAGDVMYPGGDGFIWTSGGAVSGQGGYAVGGGGGAPGVGMSTAGIAGVMAGEGGSGGNQPTYAGGAGAPGKVEIEF